MSVRSPQSDVSETMVSSVRATGIVRSIPPKARLNVLIYSLLCVVVLLAIGTLVYLPLPIPSSVNTFGTINSSQKWVLVKGTDGRLIASTFNFKTGLNEGYRVSNFDPGSSVSFSLRSSLTPGQFVTRGDTVGSIYSSETQERLIALNGELAAARGLLAVNASGQKAAIVSEAQQRLQFAKRKRDEHRTVMVRSEQLHAASLISQSEYEAVRSEDNILQDEVHIAEANLESARTGAKPEQLSLVQGNIVALENEIEAIKRRATTYTLTAPISGTVSRASSPDTLLTISDTTELVALIPVKSSDYSRVANTPDAQLTLRGLARPVHGKVIALDREMQIVQGQRVVIATALLAGPADGLMPGMLVKCRINCRPVTVLESLKRLFAGWTASQNAPWGS